MEDVDAIAFGGQLIVADRLEREPVTRAKQPHNAGNNRDHQQERDPVDQEFARLPALRDRDHDTGRKTDTGAAAQYRNLRGDETEDLSDNPGTDREIVAAQAEDEARHRNSEDNRNHTGERDRPKRRNTGKDGEPKQQISAQSHIGLLTDRDEPSIAC